MSIGLTLMIEVQKADLGMFGLALQREESGKYLDCKTFEIWLLGFSAILQAAARIRLLLVACKFFMPKPPSFLGEQMSFQALRQRDFILASSQTTVHQKFPMSTGEFG